MRGSCQDRPVWETGASSRFNVFSHASRCAPAWHRNGNRTAEVLEPEAQDNSVLRRLLAEKDAEIAALKQKLARYERQAFVEGSSETTSPSKAAALVSVLSCSFGTAPFYHAFLSGRRSQEPREHGTERSRARAGRRAVKLSRWRSTAPTKKSPLSRCAQTLRGYFHLRLARRREC